ncbi:MAG: hypothetical protein LBD12_02670, partial [Clostridiales Family XIII bacterium]|nr:hypothetical protein [Clostridiales Family XIII bacterium]
MKKRTLLITLAMILILSMFAMAACGGDPAPSGGGDEPTGDAAPAGDTADLPDMELTLTMHDPDTSRVGQALQAWADTVSQMTDGHLKISIFGSGSLAPGPEALNFVMNGSADIGWLYTMFYPDQFTLTEVVALPMNGPTHPAQTAEVLWDLYDSTPELKKELDDKVKLLQMYGNPVNFISTTSKPIEKLSDIKGLKLRCPAGGMTEVMKAWGAAPELVPPGDTYDALQKNNIGGTSWE